MKTDRYNLIFGESKKQLGHRKLKFSVDRNNFWLGIKNLEYMLGNEESDRLGLSKKTPDY